MAEGSDFSGLSSYWPIVRDRYLQSTVNLSFLHSFDSREACERRCSSAPGPAPATTATPEVNIRYISILLLKTILKAKAQLQAEAFHVIIQPLGHSTI